MSAYPQSGAEAVDPENGPTAEAAGDVPAVPESDPDFMTSLARGLSVIQAFSAQRRVLTISQISQRTGIPRAAVRRCLHTLGKLGFVSAEDGRNFALRPRILALGHAYLASTPLANAAQPVLRHMSNTLNESSSIAIPPFTPDPRGDPGLLRRNRRAAQNLEFNKFVTGVHISVVHVQSSTC